MDGHWFLVANQKTATIFTEVSKSAGNAKAKAPQTMKRRRLQQIQQLENPLGRERNRAMRRGPPGMAVRSAGRSAQVHYGLGTGQDPHEVAATDFARKISKHLEKEQNQHKFESLTIAAEPHFLGKIRSVMSEKLKNHVTQWLNKDLQKTPTTKLIHFLLPAPAPSA